MKKAIFVCLALVGAWISGAQIAHGQMPVPPVPSEGYVLDQTQTLSNEQIADLNRQITAYRERTSVQLAVLMVPEIAQDDYLERFSLNVARTWGIGEKGKNNGALLLIAKNDRRMRIEVGTGLEGDLTDVRAGRIIRDRIAPEFRQDKYYEGIASGIEGMTLAIGETNDPKLTNVTNDNGWLSNLGNIVEVVFFIGFFIITWLGAILGRTKSWWAGGVLGALLGGLGAFFFSGGGVVVTVLAALCLAALGLGFDFLVSKNYERARDSGKTPSWWAGGTTLGGGGFSGGGFGGGGFGGGGASGSW